MAGVGRIAACQALFRMLHAANYGVAMPLSRPPCDLGVDIGKLNMVPELAQSILCRATIAHRCGPHKEEKGGKTVVLGVWVRARMAPKPLFTGSPAYTRCYPAIRQADCMVLPQDSLT